MLDTHRPIAVVRIIDRLNVGGPALHAVLTSSRLDQRRFRTLLLYGDIEPGEGDMSYLLEQEPGVRAVRVPGLGRELRPVRDLRAFLFILRLLLQERPEVVHTHKTKAGLLGRVAAALAGVPVRVHTFHGHVLEGYFSSYRARAMLWMERMLAHLTTRLVTVSPRVQRDLVHKLGIAPAARFEVVPLGLDLAPFRHCDRLRGRLRAELGLPPEIRLVGMVGRMVPIKDHRTLLQAMHRLDDPQVHAVLVGSGESEPAVRQAIDELGLGGRVHLLGWRRDLPLVYADLDVLALTSRNEGTPVAIIEALCAGVPVVATAVGGVPDVLRQGRGVLVPPGDAARLSAALRMVLDDPAAVQQARDPDRRDEVMAEYGIDRLCAALGALYQRELGWRPRQPMCAQPTHPRPGVASGPAAK
ncbi:MAG: glycosyltransferase [Myxococcales bacterium]|nr:glycosyltransferase [Myxococcales bacterium]